MKKRITILMILATLLLSACGAPNTKIQDQTELYRTVEVSNPEAYKDAALSVIKGSEPDNAIFVDGFELYADDINTNADIRNWYIANNSLYIQVGSDQNNAYMYRFQFDQSNQISSYIKYSLEA